MAHHRASPFAPLASTVSINAIVQSIQAVVSDVICSPPAYLIRLDEVNDHARIGTANLTASRCITRCCNGKAIGNYGCMGPQGRKRFVRACGT
jgi:hypothetical protein